MYEIIKTVSPIEMCVRLLMFTTLSDLSLLQAVRAVREKLEVLPSLSDEERSQPTSFLGVDKFDTDLKSCVNDANRALSYQTGG